MVLEFRLVLCLAVSSIFWSRRLGCLTITVRDGSQLGGASRPIWDLLGRLAEQLNQLANPSPPFSRPLHPTMQRSRASGAYGFAGADRRPLRCRSAAVQRHGHGSRQGAALGGISGLAGHHATSVPFRVPTNNGQRPNIDAAPNSALLGRIVIVCGTGPSNTALCGKQQQANCRGRFCAHRKAPARSKLQALLLALALAPALALALGDAAIPGKLQTN